jgi:putative transposase
MPDHLHLLAAFPSDKMMTKVITDWKSLLARKLSITWQRDFFDHRLRNDESWEEKTTYIRNNPVRAQLIDTAVEWPFIWEANLSGPGRSRPT